nr:MAG TPA: hypothetical protein [Caudoviricetes sp.]
MGYIYKLYKLVIFQAVSLVNTGFITYIKRYKLI